MDELGQMAQERELAVNKLSLAIRRELEFLPDNKLVRYVAREGLGLVEIDAVNSYYQLVRKLNIGEGEILEYVRHWESVLAKKLIIALGYGGSFANWASQVLGRVPDETEEGDLGTACAWLRRFETGVKRELPKFRGMLPGKAKIFLQEKSNATCAFAIYADAERWLLDKLSLAAGRLLASLEHDGVAAGRAAAEAVVASAGSVEVAVKELPAPYDFAAEEYPELDWRLQASVSYQECRFSTRGLSESCLSGLNSISQLCTRHVKKEEARENNSDFASLVAVALAPIIHIPHEKGEKRVCFEAPFCNLRSQGCACEGL